MHHRAEFPDMKLRFVFIIELWIAVNYIKVQAAEYRTSKNVPVPDYNEAGRNLPVGVPKTVDTNGMLCSIDHHFTTPAYQKEALGLVIQEATQVAQTLKLHDEFPITQSNLVAFHISPFGFAYAYKMIGGVTTKYYSYYISSNNKFSSLSIANYDQTCQELKGHNLLSVDKIDTNIALYLATNWLSQLSINITGLNHDCIAHVAVSPYWNNLVHLGDSPQKTFVPIYYVWWTYPGDKPEGQGGAASVELYAPTKKLLQLSISDPKYNLRKPVVFTNLDALFPGVAPIHTNHFVNPIIIDAQKYFDSN